MVLYLKHKCSIVGNVTCVWQVAEAQTNELKTKY